MVTYEPTSSTWQVLFGDIVLFVGTKDGAEDYLDYCDNHKRFFSSRGELRYSPKALGDRQSDKWWLIIEADPEIGKYFRHLYHLWTYRSRKLERPAWREHVTVVRNEKPLFQSLWEKHEGEEVGFEVECLPLSDGNYCWLPIICSNALDIREELGLAREPELPLHLSIGHGVS